jgi:hypothetical protein
VRADYFFEASQSFHFVTMPFLYRNVTLRSKASISLFCDRLEQDPSLVIHVRRLCFEMKLIPMAEVTRLIDLLRPPGDDRSVHLDTLTLQGMPASQLQMAMPVLTALAPQSFQWHTVPSWQMRPAYLFEELFKAWQSSLKHVTLENFRFDDVLVTCVRQLDSLKSLSLRGNGVDFLEANTITDLLQRPISLVIANCSAEHRLELQLGLLTNSRSSSHLTWQ